MQVNLAGNLVGEIPGNRRLHEREKALASRLQLLYSCAMGLIHVSDRQKNVTYIVWDGTVTWDDWIQHVQTLVADPGWLVSSRFIADLQSVANSSSIREDQIDQATTVPGADPSRLAGKRGAVVARQEFRRATRFSDLIARFGTATVVFNQLDTACIFLGLDLQETLKQLEGLRAELRKGSC